MFTVMYVCLLAVIFHPVYEYTFYAVLPADVMFGYVAIYNDGIWNYVIQDGEWDDRAANVTCREAGFTGGG